MSNASIGASVRRIIAERYRALAIMVLTGLGLFAASFVVHDQIVMLILGIGWQLICALLIWNYTRLPCPRCGERFQGRLPYKKLFPTECSNCGAGATTQESRTE